MWLDFHFAISRSYKVIKAPSSEKLGFVAAGVRRISLGSALKLCVCLLKAVPCWEVEYGVRLYSHIVQTSTNSNQKQALPVRMRIFCNLKKKKGEKEEKK